MKNEMQIVLLIGEMSLDCAAWIYKAAEDNKAGIRSDRRAYLRDIGRKYIEECRETGINTDDFIHEAIEMGHDRDMFEGAI